MPRKADLKVTTVSTFVAEVAEADRSAAMAFFLQETTGSVLGRWVGRMSAHDQRALFGLVIGRGRLCIDGATEEVSMWVSACYGMDFSTEFCQPWGAISGGVLSRDIAQGHIAQPYRYRGTPQFDAAVAA